MHRPLLFAVLLPAVLLAPGCDALPQGGGKSSRAYDQDYIDALAVANSFCWAWRHRDVAAARAMLSQRLRKLTTEANLADAVVGATNQAHGAFEVADGGLDAKERYAYRLRLFYTYAGAAENRVEAPLEKIVVIREESGHWAVDGFPGLGQ
jgi:hypothetical protein